MRPFDLELAKQGEPVCTRDGRNARIICFDAKNESYPIVALIQDGARECVFNFGLDGRFTHTKEDVDDIDLFMKSTQHTGWINIYNYNGKIHCDSTVYTSEEVAKSHRNSVVECIGTKPISWED